MLISISREFSCMLQLMLMYILKEGDISDLRICFFLKKINLIDILIICSDV